MNEAFLLALSAALAIGAVVDARRGIIPDAVNAAILVFGLARLLALAPDALPLAALDAAIAGLLLLALRHVYRRWRGRTGLGLGDVKLVSAATLSTGLAAAQLAILLACLLALGVLAAQRLAGRRIGATSLVRFGPYLAGGFVAVLWLDRWLIF